MTVSKKELAKFKGIISALITPFDSSGRINRPVLKKLLDAQVKAGINGFFISGTAGLGPVMPIVQRKVLTELVYSIVGKKSVIIDQVGSPDTATSIELAKHAEKIGVDGIALMAPYYYAHDSTSLYAHFVRVAKSVSIPVFLYNIPRNAQVNLTADFIKKVNSSAPNVIGVKDSSRNYEHLLTLIEQLENYVIINGTDSYLYPALVMGCHAAVTGYSNAFPELYVKLYKNFKESKNNAAKKNQSKINEVRTLLSTPQITAVYEAVKIRGIDVGNPRPPFRPATPQEKASIRRGLKQIGLI